MFPHNDGVSSHGFADPPPGYEFLYSGVTLRGIPTTCEVDPDGVYDGEEDEVLEFLASRHDFNGIQFSGWSFMAEQRQKGKMERFLSAILSNPCIGNLKIIRINEPFSVKDLLPVFEKCTILEEVKINCKDQIILGPTGKRFIELLSQLRTLKVFSLISNHLVFASILAAIQSVSFKHIEYLTTEDRDGNGFLNVIERLSAIQVQHLEITGLSQDQPLTLTGLFLALRKNAYIHQLTLKWAAINAIDPSLLLSHINETVKTLQITECRVSGQSNALALLHGLEFINHANMSVLQYISHFPLLKHV